MAKRRWLAEEDRTLIQLINAGKSPLFCGQQLNRSAYSCSRRFMYMQARTDSYLRPLSRYEREILSNRVSRMILCEGKMSELARLTDLEPDFLRGIVLKKRQSIHISRYKKLVAAWRVYKTYGV